LCLLPSTAAAQSIPKIVFTDLKHGVGDLLSVWASPFRGDTKDYVTAGLALGGVALVALTDQGIGDFIHDNQESVPVEFASPWREGNFFHGRELGNAKYIGWAAMGGFAVGVIARNQDIRDAALGCGLSDRAGGIPRGYIYKLVSRERPLVVVDDTVEFQGDAYDVKVPGEETWYDNSFFGGHSANAMACASFINHRFDLGVAEPVIYALAGGVGLGRMADERHWASDTVIGTLLGFAIGKYVAERQLARARSRNSGAADGEKKPGGQSKDDPWLGGLYIQHQGLRTMIGWKGTF
jgi:membrane-associated phospholipid phosphatase